MRSVIYEGTIAHQRVWPIRHDLAYPLYMFGIDLDDLPGLNRRFPLFGFNRPGITSLWDRDYLQPGPGTIRQKLSDLLGRHGITTRVDRIFSVTSARYFNYVFNPVSFHYCFDRDRTLAAVIAEVNNTYGERHPYVLARETCVQGRWWAQFETPKVFHVSPFNRVEGEYRFYFSQPGERLAIRIELVNSGRKVMTAEFKARAVPLTTANHLETMVRYPATPHLSIPRIYAHAFQLFFQKKLAFHDKPVPGDAMTLPRQRPGLVQQVCIRLVVAALKQMTQGWLELEMPDQNTLYFGVTGSRQRATICVRDYRFFSRLVFSGDIGLGEAYMAGEWESPDLAVLTTLLAQNRDRFSDGRFMLSFMTRIKERLAHGRRKNTLDNTKVNIRAHYDLSNAFYRLFLDDWMLYSCAEFQADTLEKAQERKMARILEQADIQSHHHILEIGCGWGGFAVFAARQTGCRVTGITVSRAQFRAACQRVRDEGLDHRITIRLQDYRQTRGRFDRIVSIEMIEAVGPQFFAAYFRQCRALLVPGGRMVFQSIIIQDHRYARYCRQRDWVQKHIFPGGHLPCLKVLVHTIRAHTDFHIPDVYHLGPHYATTLSHWRQRFLAHENEIAKLGFDERFRRKWLYYFAICEAGFRTGGIDDIQMTLALDP